MCIIRVLFYVGLNLFMKLFYLKLCVVSFVYGYDFKFTLTIFVYVFRNIDFISVLVL